MAFVRSAQSARTEKSYNVKMKRLIKIEIAKTFEH